MSKKRSEHRQSQHKGNGKSPESASKASLALRYAEAGIPVVPLHGTREGCCACGDRHCKRPGKHPRTKLGIADAAIDIQDIKRMWNKWPNAKIGMVMGWPGKLLALATDGDAGRQTLQAITATREKLPRTVTIRDHDRRFRLFRVDGNPPHSRDIGEGVRILGDGELIVAPSTLSGFARDRAPGQVKIAKTPRWLVEIRATSSSDRVACESEPRPAQSKQVRLPSNDGDGDSQLVVTRAIDVTRTDVTWLWPGRIALGKVSVIAGNPGLGKSQLAAFLAATVSTGREWPCREGQAPLGDAIMLTAEDDAGDSVIPRLEVANADLSRIHFVNINNSGRTFDLLLDVQKLEQEIRRLGDIRLIIIDPITAFLKSTGMQRAVATRLQQLATNLGAAVVAVSHFAKTARTNALTQVTGSIGLVAVARAVFVVSQEKGTDRRLFLPAKNNLATVGTGLAYRIQAKAASNGTTASAVVWDSTPVTVSADEALASMSGTRKMQLALADAEDFLRVLLSAGPIPAKDVRSQATDAGISAASLRRAAATLGVKSRRTGGIAGKGRWSWELPDGSAPDDGKTRALTDAYSVPFSTE